MAQAIPDFVLGKLCEAVFQEVVGLFGVDDKVESVKRELRRIKGFLEEDGRRGGRDARVKNWVEELRDVSVLIQEAIDMYLTEVAIWTRKEPGIMNKIARAIRKPKQLKAKRILGRKIDTILERVEEITKSKERYGIENLGERRMAESAVRVAPDRYIIPDLDELQIVGFVADQKKITAQLLDENITRRSVVSIVGTGGLGKTTLAHKVYSSDAVKSRFKVRVWLSISQEFKLIDLLKKMLRKLRSIEEKEETLEDGHFIGELNQSLRNEKYLIVMDDVWSDNLWPQIVAALPDVGNGSRVLVTSRFANVAKAADRTFEPYKLPFLSKEESLELLLKTALPNRDCPTYLLDIAQQLADKCEGLPLALIVVGGLLSIKIKTRTVWGKLLKTKIWGTVDGMKCMNIISTTYDDMPSALKTCFMYMACFPEDFEINARNLIRLWVAEEFIPQQSGETLEDTAEDYLEQLAERHMVIVVRRYYDGSIRTIRVHDLLHNLAIDKAKEGNFITALSNKHVNEGESTVSFRVMLQSSSVDQLTEHVGPSIHSLHYYFDIKDFPDCSRYDKLKVCDIEARGWQCGEIRFERSNHLRFLRIRGWNLYLNLSLNLPTGDQLRNIQTLDLRRLANWDRELPEFIWGIETLRHVLFEKLHAISGPPSGAKLKNLQTLQYVNQPDSWGTQLPHLTNVRCLKLTSAKIIAPLLQTLENLISLTLVFDNHIVGKDYKQTKFESNKIVVVGEESASDEERAEQGGYINFDDEFRGFIFNEANKIANMQVFPFYHGLQKLHLSGRWVDSLDQPSVVLPPNLIKLRLEGTGLLKDPMPALEKLECLKILFLENYCYNGEKMLCSAGGFPCLEQLTLTRLQGLVELKIEEEAMPTLKLLKMGFCSVLKRLDIEEGAMPTLNLLHMSMCGLVELLPMHLTCRIEQIDPVKIPQDGLMSLRVESDADEESLPMQPTS